MKRGRKKKYATHVQPHLDRIPSWRKDGMTEEQVAKRLGIGVSTLEKYKNENVELIEALKEGKEHLIENLETSLYKRAMGYEFEEIKQYIEKDKNDKQKTKVEKTKKFIPPDTTSLIFALTNLKSEKWKHKKEVLQDINQKVQNLTIDIVDDDDNILELDEGMIADEN